MMATFSTALAAKIAAERPSRRMPFSMPQSATCMCMSAADASKIIPGTGVLTSVSLFIVVCLQSICSLLLVVLISLLLTCLTGLDGLKSLVGLKTRVAGMKTQGD